MKTTESTSSATSRTSGNIERKPANIPGDVVVKPGKEGLRFGPVVTGQVALGKDACGY